MEFKKILTLEYVINFDFNNLAREITNYCDSKYDLEASFWQGATEKDEIEFADYITDYIIKNGPEGSIPFCGYIMIDGKKCEIGDRVGKVNTGINFVKKLKIDEKCYIDNELVIISHDRGMVKVAYPNIEKELTIISN